MNELVLTLSCPNRPGIVAAVAGHLFDNGYNILDAQQYDDTEADQFFMRVVFNRTDGATDVKVLQANFTALASKFNMYWGLRECSHKRKVALLVSRFDHCLVDILYRWRINELAIEPVAIIANHPRETYGHIEFSSLPFHYFPVTKDNKSEQEARVQDVVRKSGAELVVLARYMQVLSSELAQKWAGKCINIHHSFLPGFKGARPYHQAHAHGVKLIGATAHYVTPHLDEGPIIAQDVEHISHRDSPEDLVRKGRDIERRVLAEAIRFHTEDRVLLNGRKTVVFAD